MTRFVINDLSLFGLKLIERQYLGDSRGFLSRLFCGEELAIAGWSKPIAQINFTYTNKRGTVRGLHYQQPPHAEMKLVTCLQGEIWDVVVDLRHDSPTFLQWQAENLSAKNCKSILIPEGFAHGFQALTDNVQLLYCHSEAYNRESEAGLNVQDPRISINWPLLITELSDRDAKHPLISARFKGV